jgi:hypothetical protein
LLLTLPEAGVLMFVIMGAVALDGLYWLWADYIKAGPSPEDS